MPSFGHFSKMTKQERWIWLAALLEGEGTFTPNNSGGSLRITVAMTDKDTVNMAAKIMSNHGWPKKRRTKTPTGKKGKDLYYFEISGERAAFVARQILPFMHTRRRQRIACILQHWYKGIMERLGIVCRKCGYCDPTYRKYALKGKRKRWGMR